MLSFEDKILIKNLRECKNYSSRRLIKEFPNKNWKRKTLDDFLFLLPQMRHIACDMFIFQQVSAAAHRARETVEYLSRNAPYFIGPDIWPPNSPDINSVDY